MKAAAFDTLLSTALTTPEPTVVARNRRLKEAGLMTTGARGIHAPEMVPLDAARGLLAIVAATGPADCVERVMRFGSIKYSPGFTKQIRGRETMQPDVFHELFEGESLEEVLAFMFGLPAKIGPVESAQWFLANYFHLRVFDFEVLAELFKVKKEGPETVGELVVPFQGDVMVRTERGIRHVEGFTPIKGGVRTERSITGANFLQIGLELMQ